VIYKATHLDYFCLLTEEAFNDLCYACLIANTKLLF